MGEIGDYERAMLTFAGLGAVYRRDEIPDDIDDGHGIFTRRWYLKNDILTFSIETPFSVFHIEYQYDGDEYLFDRVID